MRKLTILFIMVLALIATIALLAGCEEGILTGNAVSEPQAQDTDKWHFEPQAQETGTAATVISLSADDETEDIIIGKAYFRDFSYSLRGIRITLEGVIYDSKTKDTIPGLPVAVYCNGKSISDEGITTDDHGFFYITPDGQCTYGDEAWIQVEYNGREYESDHILIPKRIVKRSSSSKKSSGSSSDPPIGVPEFSTVTLAIAILGSGLGIAFLRKR